MTGLEKIVEKIGAESDRICAEIIEKANAEASRIIANARSESSASADAVIDKAKLEAQRTVAAAKASAETITRTKYLEVKNAIANDIISAAYEEIEKYDDEKYFDLLFALCVKNIESGECVMYLSQKDLDRLPSDFEEKINVEVFETSAVQISHKSREIENGFILDYGDFEINCTLKAVFDENMEKLKDMLCSKLFQ